MAARQSAAAVAVVGSRPSLAHAGAVVTVRNGILQDAALALRLVLDITILLVHTDHDAWHLGPADNRRELTARGASSPAKPSAHTRLPLSTASATTSSSAIVGRVNKTANKVSAKNGLSRCQDDDG